MRLVIINELGLNLFIGKRKLVVPREEERRGGEEWNTGNGHPAAGRRGTRPGRGGGEERGGYLILEDILSCYRWCDVMGIAIRVVIQHVT